MRILVTGATGYVGGRLAPRLVAAGHDVHVFVRDAARLGGRDWADQVTIHEGDARRGFRGLPEFDAAYYLIHGMGGRGDFEDEDNRAATAFANQVRTDHCIYLGGLQPKGAPAKHLRSRAEVGRILSMGLPTTEFRAGPVIGSGSASFEMCRYLTERLPVMITPRWVRNRVSTVAIRDLLAYLQAVLDVGPSGIVPIGSPPLAFGAMMQTYAEARGLRRRVLVPNPLLAPKLAARWVQFITPVPNTLAVPIIGGMAEELIADTKRAQQLFPEIEPMPYEEAVRLAIDRVVSGDVETRWSTHPPAYEVVDWENLLKEVRTLDIDKPAGKVFDVVARLGGETGWLTWRWAWALRGAMDQAIGGPGLRRGRRHPRELHVGDTVDFWRVEALEDGRQMLLRAEMKLPGRAWLRFDVEPEGSGCRLTQTAYFEPKGLPGFLYWKALYPVHRLLFRDLTRAIADAA